MRLKIGVLSDHIGTYIVSALPLAAQSPLWCCTVSAQVTLESLADMAPWGLACGACAMHAA